MKEDEYILIIGAANLDITGFSLNPLIMKDSNPGHVKLSCGGVGRNIAENLTKLDVKVKLLTAFGDDPFSMVLKENCYQNRIDISDALIVPGELSPVYLSILNNDGDMNLALCDNELLNKVDITFIKTKASLLLKASIILIDTNLSDDVIEYICQNYNQIPIFADGVSTQKSLKLKPILNNIDTIKLNILEAEALSGIKVTLNDYSELGYYFFSQGIKNIFITLGSNGVYYSNGLINLTKPTPKVNVVNATGAGDAFMAALLYGRFNELQMHQLLCFGIAASIIALSHEHTINPNLSINYINNVIEELKIC